MKKIFSIRLLLIILSAVIAYVLTCKQIPLELEKNLEDSIYQQAGTIPEDIKIIRIDEATLGELGPYSDWNRSLFARLIEILNSEEDCKPKVIGIDVIFTGTKDSSDDKALVEAARRAGNVVVTSKLELDGRSVEVDDQSYYRKSFVKSEIKPFDSLSQVVYYGFSNPLMDSDGYIRRAYGRVYSDEVEYKSFAYTIAELAFGKENLKIDKAKFGIGYTGNPGEFDSVSMSEVLNGSRGAEYFKDCIVLVGAYEEGMLDAYKNPIDHFKDMYGVEIQANIINAIRYGNEITEVDTNLQSVLGFLIILIFAIVVYKGSLKGSFFKLSFLMVCYPLSAIIIYKGTGYFLYFTYVLISAVVCVLSFLLYRYVALQKHRASEMQKTLFSMADSMAEAIEGRTPYNASHTKNVAKRSVEMLDYINKLHKEGRSELHFSQADKDQLYLAAMLHDIGKMDVPTIIMDKPTKLGSMEDPLRARLREIKLQLEVMFLKDKINRSEYKNNTELIDAFVSGLNGFNCGRPLKEEEKELISKMRDTELILESGEKLEYLTEVEYDDLMIRAGTLTENERLIMQSHVVHTDKILSHVYFGDAYKDVRRMASNHHELMNGGGYPNKIGEEQLDTMTRVLTIMDIYDSLIADDRPYKKSKPVPVAFKILDEECEAGKIDPELLKIAKEIWLKDS